MPGIPVDTAQSISPQTPGSIPSSLQEATAAVSAILHHGSNLGIEFRPISLRTMPETHFLAVFIHGLADDERVRLWAIEPLERAAIRHPGIGRLTPDLLRGVLPAPRIRHVDSLADATRGILQGATALFLDGGREAVLVETHHANQPSGGPEPGRMHKEMFGPRLAENLALIRRRLPDPALVAEPRNLPQSRADAALLYLDGQAEPSLIEAVRNWLQEKAREGALNRGKAAGTSGLLGLLPDLLSIQSPDRAAMLLDEGYVAVLVDGLTHAFVAPVTAPAILAGPGDASLRRPIAGALQSLRVVLCVLVITAPAVVVALMSYHQEMLPTPFLLAMARTRNNALFPTLLEMLGLMIMQELLQEAATRIPFTFGTGSMLIAGTLIVSLLVQTQLVGPLSAIASIIVALASFGLPSYDAAYISRMWRFLLVAGAGVFGFYGLAAGAFMLLVYLTQARSFRFPFIGETGLQFRTRGDSSSRKGGLRRAPGRAPG